jgi:putative membrane protein
VSAAQSSPAGAEPLAPQWSRLHPLSPIVQFGRALVVISAVVVPRLFLDRQRGPLFIDVGVLGLGLLGGLVHWLVTRWRVFGGELQIETGLLRRQSIRMPLTRIQSVDVVRPGLARVFGLSEVRVESAGSGTGRGRLAYLPQERALVVRAQLLALAHGLDESTPAPEEVVLWRVDNARLVASALLGWPVVLIAIVGVALGVTATIGSARAAGALGASLIPIAIVLLLAVVRRIVAEYGFRVGQAGDGLRLHAGLVQTRAQTIPPGRVQAVRWTQPLLWRPAGWFRVEVDLARQRRSGRRGSESDSSLLSRALVPVGFAADIGLVVSWVLPSATAYPALTGPPRRAMVKAPLSFRALGVWHSDSYVAARTGRLQRRTVLIPLNKVQSVRWSQGPVQRVLRLATVHVDVAGRGWHAKAGNRDAEEARQLLSALGNASARARLDSLPPDAR